MKRIAAISYSKYVALSVEEREDIRAKADTEIRTQRKRADLLTNQASQEADALVAAVRRVEAALKSPVSADTLTFLIKNRDRAAATISRTIMESNRATSEAERVQVYAEWYEEYEERLADGRIETDPSAPQE